MLSVFKRAASFLPPRWQLAMRRCLCTWKLRLGVFKHDEPEYNTLAQWVSLGDCVLDIGANVGVYTAALSALVGPKGRVFAVEPMVETFHLLAFNARLFRFPNVTLLNAAASDAAGLVGMETPTSASGLPDIYLSHLAPTATDNTVYCLPMDALPLPGKVSFVKIDVEGHELQALKGMKNLLEKHRPVLVIEGEDAEVVQFLHALGYADHRRPGSPNTVFSPTEPAAADDSADWKTAGQRQVASSAQF